MDNDKNAIRREVYLILADEPEIELYPSDEPSMWDVCAPSIDLYFEPIKLYNWHRILQQVKACQRALERQRREREE
jgi:hypothetical protein